MTVPPRHPIVAGVEGASSSEKRAGRPPLWALLVATALGAGLVPVAPGSCGTAVAVPLAWALDRAGEWAFIAALVVVSAVGSWAADVYCRATGKHDNQQIVIDEVAGYLVTLVAVPRTWPNLILGFFLFRVFDIWKPPPVRWIDRNVHGGFGVVADDLAAGVYAAIVLFLVDHFHLVARIAARFG